MWFFFFFFFTSGSHLGVANARFLIYKIKRTLEYVILPHFLGLLCNYICSTINEANHEVNTCTCNLLLWHHWKPTGQFRPHTISDGYCRLQIKSHKNCLLNIGLISCHDCGTGWKQEEAKLTWNRSLIVLNNKFYLLIYNPINKVKR